jgi:hypothetical protein
VRRPGRRAAVALGSVALLTLALTRVPGRAAASVPGVEAACAGRKVASVAADATMQAALSAYGDDNARLTDWTGGDTAFSTRLPGGDSIWLFGDTYLGAVHPPDAAHPHHWRDGTLFQQRNSAVLQDPSGHFSATLPQPPDEFAPPRTGTGGAWRWPSASIVEPSSPGSSTPVLRVLSVRFGPPGGQDVFGTPERTSVVTYSLPDLAPLGVVDLPASPLPRDEQGFYSSWAMVHGGYTYVYGHTFDTHTGDADTVSAGSAFVARVPVARLDVPGAWRFYRSASGFARWVEEQERATPIIQAAPDRGVGVNYTVLRDPSTAPPTYLLFSVDPRPLWGLARIVTYWACTPWGPWTGWNDVPFDPLALIPGAGPGTWIYHPAVHPEWTNRAGTLLSYSVNAPAAAVAGNVELYRPRFVRVTLGPA